MLCVSATMGAAAAARFDEGMRAREASRAVSEGVDGVEQRAARAALEAVGDDGDEAMAGDENIPLQYAEGGSGLSGGIKKKGKRTRSHRKSSGHRQWLAARGADLRPAADAASVS